METNKRVVDALLKRINNYQLHQTIMVQPISNQEIIESYDGDSLTQETIT